MLPILSYKLFFLPSPSKAPCILKLTAWNLYQPIILLDGHQVTPSCTDNCHLVLLFLSLLLSPVTSVSELKKKKKIVAKAFPNLQMIHFHHMSSTHSYCHTFNSAINNNHITSKISISCIPFCLSSFPILYYLSRNSLTFIQSSNPFTSPRCYCLFSCPFFPHWGACAPSNDYTCILWMTKWYFWNINCLSRSLELFTALKVISELIK